MIDVANLTDEDLASLRDAVLVECRRRDVLASASARMDQLAHDWQAATGRGDGDPWQQPTGAHDAYLSGATVTHDGMLWRSMIPFNVWPPGAVGGGWAQVITPPEPGDHVAWSVGQDLTVGDQRTHGGHLWRCRVAHVTHSGWAPSPQTWAVWDDLGPTPAQ